MRAKIALRPLRLCGSIIFLLLLLVALPAAAQDAMADGIVTADEVNAVSQRLYCPVCPNERLDTCQTQACASWREDIRQQLISGMSEDQIVSEFVRRYGERAAGTPIDPTLRALSLYTPYIITIGLLGVGAITFLRWRRRATVPAKATASAIPTEQDAGYRSMLERDLDE